MKKSSIIGVLFIFSVLINLPFLSQAFHIDDSFNLYIARQINHDPANPYNENIVYNGLLQKIYQVNANPPLDDYILAFFVRMFGEHEIPLHLCFLIFPFFIGIFMFLLSMEFLEDARIALIAAVLLLVSPAVVVMSHVIMPDIPLLCFYLAAVYFFLKGESQPFFYLLAGVFAALACLTKYTGITLIPLFALCLFFKQNARRAIPWFAVVIPILALYGWYLWSLCLYSSHYWTTLASLETGRDKVLRILMHFMANIVYIGGCSVFPLSLLYMDWRPVLKRFFIAGIIALYYAAFLHLNFDHSLIQAVFVGVLAFVTFSFLIVNLGHLKTWLLARSMRLFLFFWIVEVLVFNSFFLHTAVKYNILCIPAVILLFILTFRDSLWPKGLAFLLLTTILTGILSFSVAVGDEKFANCYREYARKIYSQYKNENNQVYFTGHWGWEYYLSQQGARPLLSLGYNNIQAGDIIVIPSIPWPQPVSKTLQNRLRLIEDIPVNSRYPLRTMNGFAKAFFYANYNFPHFTGALPYSFSVTPLEHFDIYQVQ